MAEYGIKQLWPDKLTDVSATAQTTLGTLRFDGGKIYRYIKAGPTLTGDTLSLYQTVSYITGTGFVVTNTSADIESTAGAVIVAIPENYYGWIQVSGMAILIGDGAVAFGEIVVNNGDGTVDTMAVTEEAAMVGVASEDDAATTFYVNCMLKGLM